MQADKRLEGGRWPLIPLLVSDKGPGRCDKGADALATNSGRSGAPLIPGNDTGLSGLYTHGGPLARAPVCTQERPPSLIKG